MFYDEFCKQAIKMGKSPSACVVEAGFQKSALTRWKQGMTPRRATLLKLAEYFGCTVEDLTKEEPADDGKLSQIQQMLISSVMTMSDEDVSMLLILAKQLTARGKSQDADE